MEKEMLALIEKIKEGENNPDFKVLRQSIFNMQVCSTKSETETLEWAKEFSPAGTSENWQIPENPNLKPVKCADNPNRHHYVFCC